MIVITDKSGYLGNRLWVFAHFIGWGIEHGVTIANPAFDEYAQYFVGTINDPWCCYPCRSKTPPDPQRLRHFNFRIVSKAHRLASMLRINTPWLGSLDIGLFEYYDLNDDEHIRLLCSRKLTLVRGWQFRDEVSFHKHDDAIRSYFNPLSQYVRQVDELLAQVRAKCDVLIGIHIRRGDYRKFLDGQWYYEDHVYLDMMNKLCHLFKNKTVGFLICSNEQVSPAFQSSKFSVHLGPNHPLTDMYSLARCDYLIGPPSTYSMWASYYGGVPLFQIENPNCDPTLADFVIQ